MAAAPETNEGLARVRVVVGVVVVVVVVVVVAVEVEVYVEVVTVAIWHLGEEGDLCQWPQRLWRIRGKQRRPLNNIANTDTNIRRKKVCQGESSTGSSARRSTFANDRSA